MLESTERVDPVAAELWRANLPQNFDLEMCYSVPQTDRVGKREAWKLIQALGALEHPGKDFYMAEDKDVKWWLWIPTLYQSGHLVLSAPIEKCRIATNARTYASFWFYATDGNCQKINLDPRTGISSGA